MKQCPKCGAENSDTAEFCSLCLTRFDGVVLHAPDPGPAPEHATPPDAAPAEPPSPTEGPPLADDAPLAETSAPASSSADVRRIRRVLAAVGVAVIVGLGLWLLFSFVIPPPWTYRDHVVLMNLSQNTGPSAADATSVVSLTQSVATGPQTLWLDDQGPWSRGAVGGNSPRAIVTFGSGIREWDLVGVSGPVAIVNTYEGVVRGYRLKDGAQAWEFDGESNDSPKLVDPTHLVVFSAGGATCLNAQTGAVLWTWADGATSTYVPWQPAVNNGRMYFGWNDGSFNPTDPGACDVTCLDLSSGRQIWSVSALSADGTKESAYLAPAGADGDYVLMGGGASTDGFALLNAEDGSTSWSSVTGVPLGLTDGVMTVDYSRGHVSSMDVSTHKELWSLTTYDPATDTGDMSPGGTADKGVVYLWSDANRIPTSSSGYSLMLVHVRGYSAKSGRVVLDTTMAEGQSPSFDGPYTYVPGSLGQLVAWVVRP